MPARSNIITACCIAAGLLAVPSPNHAQQLGTRDVCYRFDQSYFNWGRLSPDRLGLIHESTGIVQFTSTKHPDVVGSYRLIPPSMVADSFNMERWLRPSHWRFLAADSVEVWWYNGLYGHIFRLALRGDSLAGQVVFRGDYGNAEPRPERAFAIRTACP